MKFILRNKEVGNVVKVARISLEDAVQVVIDGTRKKDGIAVGQMITCDGNTQAHVPFHCTMESDEKISFVTGSKFLDVLDTMCYMDKDISVQVTKEKATIFCDSSHVDVELKEEMKLMDVKNDADTINVLMQASDLKKGVIRGGYCPAKDNNRNIKNVVELQFHFDESEEEKPYLSIASTDFYKGCICRVDIAGGKVISTEDGKKMVPARGKRVYALDCARFHSLAGILEDGDTQLFLNPGQLVVVNGGRVFVFRAFENAYPKRLYEIFALVENALSVEVKAADIKYAVDIISIVLNDEQREPIVITLEDGKTLVMKDSGEKSVNRIPVTSSGNMGEIGMVKEKLMTGVMKAGSENISIYFTDTNSPVFIKGDESDALYFAAPYNLRKDKKGKEDVKEKKECKENE